MLTDADIARIEDGEPENPPEITHLAIVQKFGLCAEGATESRGFASMPDAVRWVRNEVEAAHGEIGYAWPTIAPIKYDLGGEPTRISMPIWWIMTPGGPTHGFVIEIDGPSEVTKQNESQL